MTHNLLILIITPLLLGGCNSLKLGKPKEDLKIPLPDSWSTASAAYIGKVENEWLKGLGDKRIFEITKEALKNNYDLQASALLLESAKEGTIIGRAARFPSLSLSG
jgi:outer membrane protein TolC